MRAAIAVGVLLPVLETYRRGFGHWRVEFTTMFEDYFAGALLLIAAWGAMQARTWARDGLVIAWAWLTGMMTTSLVSQIEDTIREGTPEPDNALVIIVKVALFAVSVWALVSSARSRTQHSGNPQT
ncbi:MAG TPA: hypothetical protein VJR92_01180 [Gemmatimonadaceae bacterium]|nr:hypothetical protein [Gemmatimonadaceae bacterium]